MSLGVKVCPFPLTLHIYGPYHSSAACYSAVEISLLQRRDGQGPGKSFRGAKRPLERRDHRWSSDVWVEPQSAVQSVQSVQVMNRGGHTCSLADIHTRVVPYHFWIFKFWKTGWIRPWIPFRPRILLKKQRQIAGEKSYFRFRFPLRVRNGDPFMRKYSSFAADITRYHRLRFRILWILKVSKIHEFLRILKLSILKFIKFKI